MAGDATARRSSRSRRWPGRLRRPLGRDRRVVRGLDRRPGRLRPRPAEPVPRRSGHGRARSVPTARPTDVPALPASRSATAGWPGRRRPARAARAAGSRSWPGPATASAASRAPRRGRRRRPLTAIAVPSVRGPRPVRDRSPPASYRSPPIVRPRWIGRRVGAHRRPRPGRAAGSRRLPRPERAWSPSRPARSSRSPSPRSDARSTDPDRRPGRRLPVGGLRPTRTPRSSSRRTCRRRRPDRPRARSTSPNRGHGVGAQAAKVHATGEATFYDAGYDGDAPAARARSSIICGDGGCIERVVNDYGPQKPSRIVDLYRAGLLRDLRLPVVDRRRRRHGLRLLTLGRRPPARGILAR